MFELAGNVIAVVFGCCSFAFSLDVIVCCYLLLSFVCLFVGLFACSLLSLTDCLSVFVWLVGCLFGR